MCNLKNASRRAVAATLLFTSLFACNRQDEEIIPSRKRALPDASTNADGTAARTDASLVLAVTGQTPLHTAIGQMWGGSLTSTTWYGNRWRGGYNFHPTVNGTVTALAVRMPAAGTYKVSIWDAATAKLLGNAVINQPVGGQLASGKMYTYAAGDIISYTVPVKANKQYVVAVDGYTSQAYYTFGVAAAIPNKKFMPLTAGKVVINHGCWTFLPGPATNVDFVTYPGNHNFSSTVLYGYPDIVLQ